MSSPPHSELPSVVGNIEAFLENIFAQLPPPPLDHLPIRTRGRPRTFHSLCLWAGLLVCLLRGFSSKASLWRELTDHDLWFFPSINVTDDAVYKRLEQEGSQPLEQIFQHVTDLLRSRLEPFVRTDLAPFAKQIYALDETTLDQLSRMLPNLRDKPTGDRALMPGKFAGLFDVRGQQWHRLVYTDNPYQNEKVLARPILEGVPIGSLILADQGYFSFEWFDHLSDQGYHYISRLRAKTSYEVIHTFYHNELDGVLDALVWLGKYRADKAAHAVRLVQFKHGENTHTYITNVCNPIQLSIYELARVYARRWDIELAFKTLKVHLNLHFLYSAKPSLVLQQIWAALTIAQILQALQMEIAGRAKVDPFEVSLALLVQYLPRWAYTGQDPVQVFVEKGRLLKMIRPSRRTKIYAPQIKESEIAPAPLTLVLKRKARCGARVRRC